MGIIADIMNQIDTLLTDYIANAYVAVAAPLTGTLALAGGLSLIFVAINHIYNVRQISYATYISWAVRYACIIAFATVWANFNFIRSAIIETPIAFGSALIASVPVLEETKVPCGKKNPPLIRRITNSVGITQAKDPTIYCTIVTETFQKLNATEGTLYSTMDKFTSRIFGVSKNLFEKIRSLRPATWRFLVSGFIVAVVAIAFSVTSLFILFMSKVGLSVMLALGPIAIAMLTFPQTRAYFERWLSLTVGFALVPMLTMALMTMTLSVANSIQVGSSDVDTFFNGHLAFILIAIACTSLLSQVPSMTSTLAGAALPHLGGAAMMSGAKTIANNSGISLAVKGLQMATQKQKMTPAQALELLVAAKTGPVGLAAVGVKSMMQNSMKRSQKAKDAN